MRRLPLILLVACIAAILVSSADARSRRRAKQEGGQPGSFDYYLLSLSWSPEYCAGPGSGNPQQCGDQRRFGFVVHGLWPQYERGYPDSCGSADPVPSSIVNAMLPLMPSSQLIQHEWQKHGTCSGLDVNAYFQKVQKAFGTVSIPAQFKSPVSQIEVAPAAIESGFAQSNSAFPATAFQSVCSGRYLSEVRVCLTKDLHGRPCSNERTSCRTDTVIMRPLR